jgi:hypothetical protein
LACPYFMPTQKFEGGTWAHPSRLPLGFGWRGVCTAAGAQEIVPTDEQLRDSCNLGYARNCPNLPAERAWDAVRFAVAQDGETRIVVCYVCEAGHRPVEHGTLEYEVAQRSWIRSHPDARLQKMAECYLQSYTEKTRAEAVASTS